jgi:hypothetical protein
MQTECRFNMNGVQICGKVKPLNTRELRFTSDTSIAMKCKGAIKYNNVYCLDSFFFKGDIQFSILINGGTNTPFWYMKDGETYLVVLRSNRVITAMKLAEYDIHSQNITNFISQTFARELQKSS